MSYSTAVKKSKSSLTPKDHVFKSAGALLSEFRRLELQANVRAATDLDHQRLLDRFHFRKSDAPLTLTLLKAYSLEVQKFN